jgi:hypothetical protein
MHEFTVQIGDPEKMESYIVYKITAKTNLKAFKKREMSVSRRFSDFYSLQRNLSAKYPGVIVPPCPPKDAVGTFSVKMGKGEANSSSFIERRQFGLERFLRRLVMHPILVTDEMVSTPVLLPHFRFEQRGNSRLRFDCTISSSSSYTTWCLCTLARVCACVY